MRTLLVAGLLSTPLLTPAHFAPAAGWHTRVGRVHACPGVPASRCVQVFSVASTTCWRDCLACLPQVDRDRPTANSSAQMQSFGAFASRAG